MKFNIMYSILCTAFIHIYKLLPCFHDLHSYISYTFIFMRYSLLLVLHVFRDIRVTINIKDLNIDFSVKLLSSDLNFTFQGGWSGYATPRSRGTRSLRGCCDLPHVVPVGALLIALGSGEWTQGLYDDTSRIASPRLLG